MTETAKYRRHAGNNKVLYTPDISDVGDDKCPI
jgi:hypothetical protein